ncbi:MAG: carotene hydroxylase [Actinomycetota bacterium]|jgi:beta-carotene 3-hydroxylase
MLSLENVLFILGGFIGMEVVTYLVHRFVMHGFLRSLHVSHHRNAAAAYASKAPEPNDVFPLAFSVVVVVGLWVGFNVTGAAWLLPVLVGVSVYGAVYTIIHDGVIHGRIRWMKNINTTWSIRLTVAHREHHRANSEPYGMLFPTLTMQRPISDQILRSGSTPSQVPVDQ